MIKSPQRKEERKKPRAESPLPEKQDRMARAYQEMLAESERKHQEWLATLDPRHFR